MPINFPSNPTNGQTYAYGDYIYEYNSTLGVWDIQESQVVGPTGPTGPQGSIGPTGPIGATGPTGASTLAGLTDVSLSNVQGGDVLSYNSISSLWENIDVVDGGAP